MYLKILNGKINRLTNTFTAFPKTLRFNEYEKNFIINSYVNLLTNLDEDNYDRVLVERYSLLKNNRCNSLFHNGLQ